MPGNYRYEEERSRGQRGTARRGGYGERGRGGDDDELQHETERFGGAPDYGRGRSPGRYEPEDEGTRGRQGWDREYGRSLGARESFEGFDEDDNLGAAYSGGYREGNRYGSGRTDRGRRSTPGGQRGGGSMQADGWSAEPDEMRWGRQQGLYGSSEYGGYIASQRSQTDFQSHVGKGPKGWQRSDERISEELNEALARHPEIDATDIEVRVQSCEVILGGTVTDRRTKRLAEDVAERVFGVKDVQNQIRVQPSTERASFGSFSERDVTPVTDREGRISETQESQTRRERGTTRGTTR